MIDSHCHLDQEPLFGKITDIIERSKLSPGKDIAVCLDVAAYELKNEKGEYSVQSKNYAPVEQIISYSFL